MSNFDTSLLHSMASGNQPPRRTHIQQSYADDFHQSYGQDELRHSYGEFAKMARKLIKEDGLVQENKYDVKRILDKTSERMRNYIHSDSHTEDEYIALRGEIRGSLMSAMNYKQGAERNLAAHRRYQANVAELNAKYGMEIPILPFDYCSSSEERKIKQLLKDANEGKAVKYEFPDDFNESELKELESMGIKIPRAGNAIDNASMQNQANITPTPQGELPSSAQTSATHDDNDESLNELKSQYRQFCHVARPLAKQVGLVTQNKTELEKLIDETQKAMRGYLHSQNRTDADYDALQRRLRAACQKANDYEATVKRNLERYGKYRKNIAELHDTYGIDIPVFPFDYCGSDEEMKIDGLLKDAKAGKQVKYELPDYYDESELDAMGIVTQRCDSMKDVASCVENEARYIPANETVAHDIDISRTGDGRYAVQSELPRNISTDGESDTEPSNVGDILQSRYPNGDVSISFGGNTIPFDALRNIDTVDVDGNMVPVPDDPDALRSAVSKGWESGSQDMRTPINSFPSLSTRAAAPSVSARDRAKTIRNGMRKWEEAEEETVWVTAHFRGGTFINLYPRSRPHRNGNGNGNGKK